MSLGATASAPASTWLTAVRASSSSVSSFATSPSRMTPQWPCAVYSQRQTSVIEHELRVLGAERTQRALHDPVLVPGARALVVLLVGDAEEEDRLDAERERARRPRRRGRRRSNGSSPGSCSFRTVEGPAKSGITKSSRSSRVSRTRPLRASVRRSRRRRVAGNALTPTLYAGSGAGGSPPSAGGALRPEDPHLERCVRGVAELPLELCHSHSRSAFRPQGTSRVQHGRPAPGVITPTGHSRPWAAPPPPRPEEPPLRPTARASPARRRTPRSPARRRARAARRGPRRSRTAPRPRAARR